MVANYRLITEARAIASGTSDVAPTSAHIQALFELIDTMVAACEERSEVIAALLHRPPVPRYQHCS